MAIRSSFAVLVLLLARGADAQDLNVKCAGPAPSPVYGAASGQAGTWNLLQMTTIGAPATPMPLAGSNGGSTGATAVAEGCDEAACDGCEPSSSCPGFSGSADDVALLGSWFNGDCHASGHNVQVADLAPGSYRMHLYVYHGCSPGSVGNLNVQVRDKDLNVLVSSDFQVGGVAFQGSWAGFPFVVTSFDIAPGDSIKIVWGHFFGGLCGFQLERLDETGSPFCPGDGSVGACPCGNQGGIGRGCENSTATGGAALFASGVASLTADTLEFASAWERRIALTIFLQGNALVAPGPFGDGVRCTGGSLKRLYSRNAVQGAVMAPIAGEPAVSVRSAQKGDTIPAGGIRWYQTYYRDNAPAFCPLPQGSNFNSSSGIRIAWGG